MINITGRGSWSGIEDLLIGVHAFITIQRHSDTYIVYVIKSTTLGVIYANLAGRQQWAWCTRLGKSTLIRMPLALFFFRFCEITEAAKEAGKL